MREFAAKRSSLFDVADVPERETADRVQMKHELAGASVAEQRERLQPPMPLLLPPEPVVQCQGMDTGVDAPDVKQIAATGLSGSATALPHLDRIQHSFGTHDLSDVKAFVGGEAARASSAMRAAAYTTGDKIAFRESPDLHTAAHEAAHVVQQKKGVALSGGVGRAGDPYEKHADAVADRVVRGQSAESLLEQMPIAGASHKAAVQKEDVTPVAEPLEMGVEASGGAQASGNVSGNVWQDKSSTPDEVWKTLLSIPRYRKIVCGGKATGGLYKALKQQFISSGLSNDKYNVKEDVLRQAQTRDEDDLEWSSFKQLVENTTNVHVQNRWALDDLCKRVVEIDGSINKGMNWINFGWKMLPGVRLMRAYLLRQDDKSIAYFYGMSKG